MVHMSSMFFFCSIFLVHQGHELRFSFAGMINYAIATPCWNVPVDLATGKIAPKVLAGQSLEAMRMKAPSDWSDSLSLRCISTASLPSHHLLSLSRHHCCHVRTKAHHCFCQPLACTVVFGEHVAAGLLLRAR